MGASAVILGFSGATTAYYFANQDAALVSAAQETDPSMANYLSNSQLAHVQARHTWEVGGEVVGAAVGVGGIFTTILAPFLAVGSISEQRKPPEQP